jgi:tripartite-type tricarboxylate transporter receptor subunit TctC
MYRRELLIATLGALLLGAPAVSAQSAGTYPNKPIRIIVPFAPGATTDFLARTIGQHINQAWGQPAVVDNRPGAGGLLGMEVVARSAGDGYTVAVMTGSLSMYPAIMTKLSFDPVKDFEFITLIARVPNVLVVHQSHPAKTFNEFVENAKKDPGQSYASSGTGTNTHFTGEMLKLGSSLDLQHVSYRGGAPAMADLVAGHVKIMMASLTTAMPHIKSGKIRPLAVSGGSRSEVVPDVPTLKELGFSNIDTSEWWAVIAPKGTAKEVLDMWAIEVKKVVGDPSLKEKSPGIELGTSSSDELRTLVVREVDTWKDVAKKANIGAE